MSRVAIVTMVQASDLPHAFCALDSAAKARRADDLHLVLLNDKSNSELAKTLRDVSGAEIIEAGGNLGVAGGRNRLIREAMARGAEFILSIDDDILAPPDFVDVLTSEYGRLSDAGRNPGVLTPATLDFHAIGAAIFGEDDLSRIREGLAVDTPESADLRRLLSAKERRRARDIYHMGIADWRGAYLYDGGPEDRIIQSLYGVEPPRLAGVESHLRHAKYAWSWILSGGDPQPVDSAPGGVCFYSVGLVNEAGFHDEGFNPFGFEDADFSLRARRRGFQHFCAPRAIAIHDIAARLSERPVAALRATQGKMAGAFARKHVEGREAVAAFASIARRTVETVTLGEFAKREQTELLKTPGRLAGLIAFFANAAIYALPTRDEPPELLLNRVRRIAGALAPVSERLQQTELGDGFELSGESGLKIRARSISRPSGESISVAGSGLSILRSLSPRLLTAAAGGCDFRFDIEFKLELIGNGCARLSDLKLSAPGSFRLRAAANLTRESSPSGGIEPVKITDAVLRFDDDGSLARVLRLLAETERLSPAEFVRNLASNDAPPALKRLLAGEVGSLTMTFSAAIDGSPGPVAFSADFSEVENAAPNPAVAALSNEEESPPAQHEDEKQMAGAEVKRMSLKELIGRMVADDPAVAPFPETYNPPKPLRLARRLRYYSAARGVPLSPNEAKLVSFRNRHRSERAFIIGNGPSLNLVDLTKLKGETTFGVNAIYLNQEKMGFLPTHHIVEDVFVAEDRAAEINALRGPHKWYGHYLRYCLKPTPEVCWLNVACDYRNYPGFPHFSTNAARIVWVGGTVSYIALQLAYHMGFQEVHLVGFDHSYSIPKEAKVDGRAITSTSDDPNHFHPGYFGKGYRWHDPRVDRMERAYINARSAFEAAGRRIYNATVGGRLEVFERVSYDSLFR